MIIVVNLLVQPSTVCLRTATSEFDWCCCRSLRSNSTICRRIVWVCMSGFPSNQLLTALTTFARTFCWRVVQISSFSLSFPESWHCCFFDVIWEFILESNWLSRSFICKLQKIFQAQVTSEEKQSRTNRTITNISLNYRYLLLQTFVKLLFSSGFVL